MHRLQTCRNLALLACLLLAAPAPGAGQEPPSPPPAAGLAEARSLVRLGRHEEALAVLRPLIRGAKVEANVIFHLGLAAIGAAERPGIAEDRRTELLDEAIAALRAMLVSRPDLVRVRLELARAFFLKGEDGLARRHFEQVLAGNLPRNAVDKVNRFLARIQARKRWSVRVHLSLAPDSNVGATTDERVIYIFGFPASFNPPDPASSGVGVSFSASGDYHYPLDEGGRLRLGAAVSRTEYEGSKHDWMRVSGHVGPRWLVDGTTEASLLASVRQYWLADEVDHRDFGFRAEARHRLSGRATAILGGALHARRHPKQALLDGPVTDVSVDLGWVATPTLRIDSALGWGRQWTRTRNWRHTRRWVRTGFTAALPWGFTLGASGSLRWTNYEGDWLPHTPSGQPRRDVVRSLSLNLHNRALTVAGFSPQISLTRERRITNAQLYGYKRTSGEVRFVRLF